MGIINDIKKRFGAYFQTPIPDIYSGLANVSAVESFVYSYRPLSVWACSKHSTGMSTSYGHTNKHAVNQVEVGQTGVLNSALEPELEGGQNTEALMIDTLLKCKKLFFADDAEVSINWQKILQFIATPCARYSVPEEYAAATQYIRLVAARTNVPLDSISIPERTEGPAKLINACNFVPARETITFDFSTDPGICSDVYEFVNFASRMNIGADALYVRTIAASTRTTPGQGEKDLRIEQLERELSESQHTSKEKQKVIEELDHAAKERLKIIEELRAQAQARKQSHGEGWTPFKLAYSLYKRIW